MIHLRPTKELILKYYDSYDIFRYYCPNFREVGKSFVSDIRTNDNNPSAQISFIRGDLLYTDFGEGSYRVFDYVGRKYGLSFHQALDKIASDFGLFKKDKTHHIPVYKESLKKFKEKRPSIIRIKSKDFNKKALEYWNSYYWTPYMLEHIGVKSISHFFITNESKNLYNEMFDVNHTLAFSYEYYLLNGLFRRKLYFPNKRKEYKFLTNGDQTIVQGWDTLPKSGGDILFITSSLKDIGPFWRLGYYAVAPNSERLFIPSIPWDKLKERWKRIIIWYDNDQTGITDAKKFSRIHNIEYYYNPIRGPKDPADYAKVENLREFNWLIQQIL